MIPAGMFARPKPARGADCVFLLHSDGNNGDVTFPNSVAAVGAVTVVGNAQVSTDTSKFGGASIKFDGTTDALRYASNATWGFGTGDFTVDYWLNFTTMARNSNPLLVTSSFQIEHTAANDFQVSQFGISNLLSYDLDTSSITTGTWHHYACTRTGGTIRAFLDGVIVDSASNSTNFAAGALTLGAISDNTRSLAGYMDEIRIRKGTAEWTANFIPYSAPYA